MLPTLAISAINPALLWGALAVASPIIIHLLSKRKFKIINWAAMDFLLEADKRNRRRVRLEQLILLLLRCLACVLIALMVARPFRESEGFAFLLGDTTYERIVVLDDSPSMQHQSEGKVTFDETKKWLASYVRDLSRQRSRDTLTVRLTSRPDKPAIAGASLTGDRIEQVVRDIENLQPSDLSANLGRALLEVEKSLEDTGGPANHVIYVVTDLRQRDWLEEAGGADGEEAAKPASDGAGTQPRAASPTSDGNAKSAPEQDPAGILKRLREKATDVTIFDVGADAIENLSVVGITSSTRAIVRGVETEFTVLVRNNGQQTANDIEVVFTPGESVERRGRIETLGAGQTVGARFSMIFAEPGSVQMTATVGADALRSDNTFFYSARVQEGIQVLLVNGDPGADRDRSELNFLQRALKPSDRVQLGFVVEEMTESQFETAELSRYQVVVLANLYRVTEDRAAVLERWVKAGGGLFISMGDQIDETIYNQLLYKEGKGLLPVQLDGVRGDETERTWVSLDIEDASHPVLNKWTGDLKPLISVVKVFRWMHGIADKKAIDAGRVSVPLRLTNPEGSPAIVEQTFGKGRVVVLMTSCDADWNDWPKYASYLPTIAMYAEEHLPRITAAEGVMPVGTPISFELDSARYQTEARIVPRLPEHADAQPQTLSAVLTDEGKRMVLEYDKTQRAGFYNLELKARDGQDRLVGYAANIDPTEGRLARVSEEQMKKKLGDAPIKLLRIADVSQDAGGAKAEFWRELLLILALCLCVEQFLAWSFGRRR